jgi:hypothetical protein
MWRIDSTKKSSAPASLFDHTAGTEAVAEEELVNELLNMPIPQTTVSVNFQCEK